MVRMMVVAMINAMLVMVVVAAMQMPVPWHWCCHAAARHGPLAGGESRELPKP